MHFDNRISDILSGLQIVIAKTPEGEEECDCHKTTFDKFKEFVIQDISNQEGDCSCDAGEQSTIAQQLQNSTSIEQIEVFLGQSGYCPESILKLYKQFIQAE